MEHIGAILEREEKSRGEVVTKPRSNTEPQADTEAIGKYSFGVSDEHHTFRGFKRVAGTAEVYKAFRDLAEGTSEYCFLLAYGGVGNGKTHLLEATALRLAERGIRSTVWVVPDFVSYLRRLINPEWPGRLDGVLERYQASSGAVLFDDFCLEYGTAWEESIMERIICGRYRNKGITVITTNKDLDTMPERIVSRFFEPGVGKVVLNEGKDFRRRGTRL